ncbi:MAG: DUF3021 domain-containing protein [Lachnospiraceae bacterium]|nr:DUF3021 domain-containing protein [Lachnospiraceae bacterium]
MNKKVSLWERYLTGEIGIEFKSCLYFFAILFYYCFYRVSNGVYSADILHMTEMILLCYVIGYAQVYLFHNFDEAWKYAPLEITGFIVCTAVYTGASVFLGWLDHSLWWTVGFAAYVVVLYICVIIIYYTKRKIDDKKLNQELEMFQSGMKTEEDDRE